MKTRWKKLNPRLCCVIALCLIMVATVMLIRPADVYAASNGWQQDEYDNWYYYENDKPVTGWKEIDGKWYSFDAGGMMRSDGLWELDGKWYKFNEKGHLLGAGGGWFKEDRDWDEDGKIDYTNWYYAEKGGALVSGWKEIDGYWYYFDHEMYVDGIRVVYNGESYENSPRYYFDKKGHLLGVGGGWFKVDSDWDGDGTIDYTEWYYAKKGGALLTGWQAIDGYWYYFGEYDGMYKDGTRRVPNGKIKESGEPEYDAYYFNEKGQMQGEAGGWFKVKNWRGDCWYYSEKGGVLVTGWKKIDGAWYYFDDYDGIMYADGVYNTGNTINNEKVEYDYYYFNENGQMQGANGGWIRKDLDSERYAYTDPSWYFAEKGGKLVEGWKQIAGTWYYFTPSMVKNGSTIDENGKAYAFDENGAMLGKGGGWISTTSYRFWADSQNDQHRGSVEPPRWYYAKEDGELVTGWMKTGNTWFYFDEYGRMLTGGAYYISDGYYHFAENGAMLGGAGGWTNVKYINKYYDGTGKLVTEDRNFWIFTEKGGKAVEDGWKTIGDKTYYFSYGQMAQGSVYVNAEEKTYVFDQNGALSKGGWVKGKVVGGKTQWYYANSDGTAKEGWLKEGGKWYYISQGTMRRGLVYPDDNGEKAYVLTDDGTLSTGGWVSIKNRTSAIPSWYYANSDGTAVNGWKKLGGKWYYFNNSMVYDQDRYYIHENGKTTYHKFALDGTWVSEV